MHALHVVFFFFVNAVWSDVCTPPSGYPGPPVGCPFEMLSCGQFGAFPKANCSCWYGDVVWNEVNVCNCLEGWTGSDCSIVESQDQCPDGSVYDGTFVLPGTNVTHKHIECYLDQEYQEYLDLEDHRVNISITPATSEPAASFNISVVVLSRIHHHEQPYPYQWAPVIPALWCSAAWCGVVEYPLNETNSYVQYSCPYVSCDACTPQNGDCNVILSATARLIKATEQRPVEIIVQDAEIGQGSFRLVTNILALTGYCFVGQCNPWSDEVETFL